jgi:hypothetical protein
MTGVISPMSPLRVYSAVIINAQIAHSLPFHLIEFLYKNLWSVSFTAYEGAQLSLILHDL